MRLKYPENTNVKTQYVYSNPSVLNGGSAAVTDGRNVSIKVFHTFMNMPKDDYSPRMDDARVGYFLTETNDMTATSTVNYRDMIHRWKLIKKKSRGFYIRTGNSNYLVDRKHNSSRMERNN